jgi:translation initiation factor 1
MKKRKDDLPSIVYSTDASFNPFTPDEIAVTLPPAQQSLRISLETKHRAGKTVTLVLGFVGNELDLGELGKKLKNYCGTGGSAKDGEVILQGDHRDKVRLWLQKNNYKVK